MVLKLYMLLFYSDALASYLKVNINILYIYVNCCVLYQVSGVSTLMTVYGHRTFDEDREAIQGMSTGSSLSQPRINPFPSSLRIFREATLLPCSGTLSYSTV